MGKWEFYSGNEGFLKSYDFYSRIEDFLKYSNSFTRAFHAILPVCWDIPIKTISRLGTYGKVKGRKC